MRTFLLICVGLGIAGLHTSSVGARSAQVKPTKDEPLTQGKPLRYWIDQLNDDDILIREKAIEVLAIVGAPARDAVPALQALLKNEMPTVRIRAAIALWKIDRQSAAVERS